MICLMDTEYGQDEVRTIRGLVDKYNGKDLSIDDYYKLNECVCKNINANERYGYKIVDNYNGVYHFFNKENEDGISVSIDQKGKVRARLMKPIYINEGTASQVGWFFAETKKFHPILHFRARKIAKQIQKMVNNIPENI